MLDFNFGYANKKVGCNNEQSAGNLSFFKKGKRIGILRDYTRNWEDPRRYSPSLAESLEVQLTLIELVWTISPAVFLILIAFPSFKLLYLMDEVTDPALALLAEGHQWY